MPHISIIVPVYNVAEYLEACLESVAAQTFTDYECLLVDDGSKDTSGAICDDWHAKDPRFIAIHKPNGGAGSARNAALRAARGEWLCFVDGDDWMEPDALETFVCTSQKYPNSDIVCCGYYYYDSPACDLPLISPDKRNTFHGEVGPQEAFARLIRPHGYFTSLWNKMVRRELILHSSQDGALLPFDESGRIGSDDMLWLTALLPQCRAFCFTPEPKYHWRYRDGSETHGDLIKQFEPLEVGVQMLDSIQLLGKKCVKLEEASLGYKAVRLAKQAYLTGETDLLPRVRKIIKGRLGAFLTSDFCPPLARLKMLLWLVLITLKVSPEWLQKTVDQIKANRKRRPVG